MKKVQTKLLEMLLSDFVLGMYSISLVGKPAIKSDFLALADEHTVLLKVQDPDKRILTGAILIPNLPIYRKNPETGEEYHIFFKADTVRGVAEKYMKDKNQSNVTLEHMVPVENVTLIETWIKEDPVHDKSVALGIDAPIGTWMGTMKVDDEVIWNDFIKEGHLKGFSVEGKMAASQVALNTNINQKELDMPKKKTITERLANLVKPLGIEVVTAESQVAEISKWEQTVINDTFAIGDKVERKPFDDDGTPEKISSGEYELDDGRKILVDGDGIIQFIKDTPTATTPPAVEAEEEEVVVEAAEETPEEPTEEEEEITYVTVESFNEVVGRLEEAEKALETIATYFEDKAKEEKAKAEAVAEAKADKEEATLEVAASETPKKEETVEAPVKKVALADTPEETVEMVSLTSSQKTTGIKKAKFNHKLSIEDRVKANLALNN